MREYVVAEDIGAEDLTERRLLYAGSGGRELRFCGDAQATFVEGWVCDAVDEVDRCQPECLRPVHTDIVRDAGVEDEGVEFGYGGEESLGDIADGVEDGEVDLFSLEGDSIFGVRCVAVKVFSQAGDGVIALFDGPGGDDEP